MTTLNNAKLKGVWLDAGDVEPSQKKYRITYPHDVRSLKTDDVVQMVVTPHGSNYLLRVTDMSLHNIKDDSSQYVHLEEVN